MRNSIQGLSPYLGRISSEMARFLIRDYSKRNNVVLDPFCGVGTIPFEAWVQQRKAIATDLNPYAYAVTKGKLAPPKDFNIAIKKFNLYQELVEQSINSNRKFDHPDWVKAFFHEQTLKEISIWFEILRFKKDYFMMSCLLGILHHQRPGFLSYPASNVIPYLRANKFPPIEFPELYSYRAVGVRLEKKIRRVYSNFPELDFSIDRSCFCRNATKINAIDEIDAIITSPPYMQQLDYGRDNRLRLYFLGITDWKTLNHQISPKESEFLKLMGICFQKWHLGIKKKGKVVLVLGDNLGGRSKLPLRDLIEDLAVSKLNLFRTIDKFESEIPNEKRIVKEVKGNKFEHIIVLQKK